MKDIKDHVRDFYREEYRKNFLATNNDFASTIENARWKATDFLKKNSLKTVLFTIGGSVLVAAVLVAAFTPLTALVLAGSVAVTTIIVCESTGMIVENRINKMLNADIKNGTLVKRQAEELKKAFPHETSIDLQNLKVAAAFDCAACKARAAAPVSNIPASIPNIPGW